MKSIDPTKLDTETLIKLCQEKAKVTTDGHLTIFRFTSHWKVFGGTPNLDSGGERETISAINGHTDLNSALIEYLLREQKSC